MTRITLTYATIDPEKFRQRAAAIARDHVAQLARELREESPVGATEELSKNWYAETLTRLPNFAIELGNDSGAALYRTRGRGPGKFPAKEPIDEWLKAKGIPLSASFPIRRAIAKRGTGRFRARKNFAGIALDGKLQPGGKIAQSSRELAAKLRQIRV